MSEAFTRLPELTVAHLRLVLLALVIGVGISVPLGIVAAKRPRLGRLLLGGVAVLQTIPGLALLALAVVALAALGTTSIGFGPAIVALTLYSMLPVMRNTLTGLNEVDPAVREAALGVGMDGWQSLLRVELPLALPMIMAGIRTAAVWVVGTATLSTPVGAPSLGDLIFAGLQTRKNALVLVGCLAAAALALILEGALTLLQRQMTRRLSRPFVGVAVAMVAAALGLVFMPFSSQQAPVKIGAKSFTEQYILAEILAQQIQQETGHPTQVMASLGSTVAFDALAAGDLDAYVDYSGTLWATVLKRSGKSPGRKAVLDDVRRALPDLFSVEVVGALGFENTYALAMPRKKAEALGIADLGDLAARGQHLTMGADYEFFSRAEWKSLVETYGLAFAEKKTMDPSLMYQAAKNGDVDVISAYSTDGRIEAFGLAVLADPRGAIPPYDALVLGRGDLPAAVRDALAALSGSLSDAQMRRLNQAVDGQKKSPAEVAREFFKSRSQTPP
jgi:osmoprotectant transport system permease protein